MPQALFVPLSAHCQLLRRGRCAELEFLLRTIPAVFSGAGAK